MNAIDMKPAMAAPAQLTPAQGALDLVGRVAAARIRSAMAESPERQVLFMIAGLGKNLTSAVALHIKREMPSVTVELHVDMADESIPDSMISRKSLGDYRNLPFSEFGGAVVFAPSAKELDDVGKTSGDIQQISEEILSASPELWIENAQFLKTLDERNRKSLINVLQGLVTSQVLTNGIQMFGEFIWRVNYEADAIPEIERAIDFALPALRIPRGAGRFKKLAAKGRVPSAATWAERFKTLHATAEDSLQLRRDGIPLPRTPLKERLSQLVGEGEVEEAERAALAALIADTEIKPGMWLPTQAAVAELRSELVDRLVKASKRKVQRPLAEATLTSFESNMKGVLTPEDRVALSSLTDGAENADEEERAFFFRQRANILECSKPLFKRWEQYIFKRTEQHSDLALGLFMAIADLVEGTESQPAVPGVYVRLQGANRLKFWETHNPDLCRYMRDRYRGLDVIFKPSGVVLDFGMCWTGNWDHAGGASRSSKMSREFKFDILLLDVAGKQDWANQSEMLDGMLRKPIATTQFVWTMPGDSIASSFTESMAEIADHAKTHALLASGRFTRAQDQERSTDGRISLERRSTFQDANGRPEGILVDPNAERDRVGDRFEKALEQLRGDVLPASEAEAVEAAYLRFRGSYTHAIRGLVGFNGSEGLGTPALLEQAALFGELLEVLRSRARKDDCRKSLWEPILGLGIAYSEDRPPVAICAPWHPFKLAAAAAKALRLGDAVKKVLGGGALDIRTFSRTIARTVSDGWYPSVALFPTIGKACLVAETDRFADFGLMEAPTADQGADDAFDGFSDQATRELLDIADEYLEIQPHERANFSIVLYNADNRSLPSYLANSLASKVENEKDLRCDLILTHSDQRRLRQIYTEQNVAVSNRLEGAMTSDAAQTFLSRLRVGFIDLGEFAKEEQSVQAADLVFLHDVIARAAHTAWRRVPEPPRGWLPFEQSSPDGETRLRHMEKGTRKTESLLVPAERPLEVQRYLNLVRDMHLDFRDPPDGHYVPVREINFDAGGVGAIIDQAHKVARWVVTYDAIADVNLFRNNNVNIIRYVPRPDRNHNLVVSTRQPGAMLVSKLSEQIGTILGASGANIEALARTCIDEASSISGRVVLRAARLENNALELLGLVLSKRVFLDSVEAGITPVCWLLLDDFADRIGHPSRGPKADILIVCLSSSDDVPTVDLVVVESKFVSVESESASMQDSMMQMRVSTADVRDRIVGRSDLLNRPTWLRRLADLMLEQGSFVGPIQGHEPQEWARLIRSDEAVLRISGLSFVFVHDREESQAEPLIATSSEQKQYTFGKKQVAEGLRRVQTIAAGQH